MFTEEIFHGFFSFTFPLLFVPHGFHYGCYLLTFVTSIPHDSSTLSPVYVITHIQHDLSIFCACLVPWISLPLFNKISASLNHLGFLTFLVLSFSVWYESLTVQLCPLPNQLISCRLRVCVSTWLRSPAPLEYYSSINTIVYDLDLGVSCLHVVVFSIHFFLSSIGCCYFVLVGFIVNHVNAPVWFCVTYFFTMFYISVFDLMLIFMALFMSCVFTD